MPDLWRAPRGRGGTLVFLHGSDPACQPDRRGLSHLRAIALWWSPARRSPKRLSLSPPARNGFLHRMVVAVQHIGNGRRLIAHLQLRPSRQGGPVRRIFLAQQHGSRLGIEEARASSRSKAASRALPTAQRAILAAMLIRSMTTRSARGAWPVVGKPLGFV